MAQSILDANAIQGQEIASHQQLKFGVFPHALKEGRFLEPQDRGKPHIVISRRIANDHKGKDGRPKKVGDTLHIGEKDFTIIGLYETGSMFLDVVIVMDIDTARSFIPLPKDYVSSCYVEANDPAQIEHVARAIEEELPGVDARSMQEFQANFGMLMSQVDTFLMMTVSLALVVGIVGIVNTMLMSTTERFAEFGVLRTNGWSQANVLTLVTAESAYLGLLAGILGCVLAFVGATVANQFITGGLQLQVTPRLMALGIGLSVVMGTLGGLYPAWRAARLVPMEAIRLGAH
jgi:putative ABC transport system permease protein